VKLEYPIKDRNGNDIDVLVIPNRIKFKTMRVIDRVEGNLDRAAAVIASLCGIPEASVDELSPADVENLMEKIDPLLDALLDTTGKGAETGSSPSE